MREKIVPPNWQTEKSKGVRVFSDQRKRKVQGKSKHYPHHTTKTRALDRDRGKGTNQQVENPCMHGKIRKRDRDVGKSNGT